ncbi:hypothetical protein RJT34_28120 [Clitoria ternatea]|uniref:Uncharacterized protein n=1 Tax=Clitoria ternatea TaxID=43366 RepID=A0AAN9IGQ0_CLITE
MDDTNTHTTSLLQTHQPNPTSEPLLHALDPISLILNQNSLKNQPFPLRLTSADSFIMERGPNYAAYAEFREKRLRAKRSIQEQQEPTKLSTPEGKKHIKMQEEQEPIKLTTPPRKKQVKFQTCGGNPKGSSVVAQSVPDFSAALRKENRKPINATTLPSRMEMTPPPCKSGNNGMVGLSSRGSKSVSGGEKKGGGGVMMARKSYACIDELKSLSSATAIAINGEGRGGGRSGRVVGKTISGHHRKF